VDFRRSNINDLQLNATTYNFTTLQTGNGTNSNTGNSFASLLLGLSSSYAADTNTGRFYERSNYFSTYAQDIYKLRSNLTLNLGLRYDVEQNPNELDYNGSNFDLGSGQIITMRQLGTNRIQYTQWANFGPRVGFTWNPWSKGTVVRGSYGIFYMPLTGRATSAYDRFPKDQSYTLQTSNYTSAVLLSQTPAIQPSTNGYNLNHQYDDPQAHVPYFQQASFDIQQQLPWQWVVKVGYTNSVSRHLWENVQFNQIPIGQVQAAGGGTQAMRPYSNFANIGNFLEAQSTSYNALLVEAERRFDHGLMLQMAYTWSKFIDVNDDNFSGLYPQDQYNMKAERGLSLANIPAHLVIAGLYDLPFGEGRAFAQHGVAAAVIGGWQAGGILTIQSGQQTWIHSANNTSETFSQMMRPNLSGSPFATGSQRTLTHWFNTAAFSAPPLLHFGNSPKTPITDSTKLELRGECFNCFNHPNFLPPNGVFGNPTFGQITAANPARIIQIGGKLWF
jgi:hypothetical protein